MTYSFEGAAAECPIIRLSYSLKGTSHESDFTVTDASTFGVFQEESDMLVEGIMGLPFLVEHRCVIDYIYGNVTLIV